MSLTARLDAARVNAIAGGLPTRRKDAALYAMLAECLAICELVDKDGLHDELRAALRVSIDCRDPAIWGAGRAKSNNGRGRRYAEADADACVLVARYVLDGVDSRNSTYRYAITLRQAARRKISSDNLAEWLTSNGGVRALFLTRPVDARSVSTKTLHLNEAITVQKDETFSVVLRRNAGGWFDVISHPMAVRAAA